MDNITNDMKDIAEEFENVVNVTNEPLVKADKDIETIEVNGKTCDVFTVLKITNKQYVITEGKNEQGETTFDIYLKDKDSYIRPEDGEDKIYDRCKKMLSERVPLDVILDDNEIEK